MVYPPTLVVTHQLQVERGTGKVRQSETDVLLSHATHRRNWRKLGKRVRRACSKSRKISASKSTEAPSRRTVFRRDELCHHVSARPSTMADGGCAITSTHVPVLRRRTDVLRYTYLVYVTSVYYCYFLCVFVFFLNLGRYIPEGV